MPSFSDLLQRTYHIKFSVKSNKSRREVKSIAESFSPYEVRENCSLSCSTLTPSVPASSHPVVAMPKRRNGYEAAKAHLPSNKLQ